MPARRKPLTAVAVVAIVFGLLTIVSGGRALFGGADMGPSSRSFCGSTS